MIYISSACVKNETIKDSVLELVDYGFKNIELSGGTKYYEGIEDDLLALKEEYNLNLICHNYFPPPQTPFVLNLASLDQETNDRSLEHVLKTIKLSKKIGAEIFAFHAGFLIDIPVDEIGKPIKRRKLFDRDKALENFVRNLRIIYKEAEGIELYIENNVLSSANHENYLPHQPFFFLDFDSYQEVNDCFPFTPLLDVAHLKVSTNVLNKDFGTHLEKISALTDYIHISDNDGFFDTNQHLSTESELYKHLKAINLKNKHITLEVYNGLDKVMESYNNIQLLIQES